LNLGDFATFIIIIIIIRFVKRQNVKRLPWRLGPCDLHLDLGSGSRSYSCASVIEYYLCTKFHQNQRKVLWMDGRTDVLTEI